MGSWWEQAAPTAPQYRARAVAYYRHSAQDRQKNSVEIQSDQVRKWATENAVEILHEFMDRGKSGLTAEGRPEFNNMMEWVRTRQDFEFILVLDVSRWGRFQDIDLSAQYSAECKKFGKEVVYTNLGIENDGSPVYPLVVNFERWRSAQYSRELSDKVWKGCVKISEQGYRAGGAAPYGMHRLMVNENDEPEKVLEAGEHKSIQNWRVKLTPGEEQQVQVVQEIFFQFVERGLDEKQIAGLLNSRGLASPGGVSWKPPAVRRILTNRTYEGDVVYNRTTAKLKTPQRPNPEELWVVTPEAYEAIIPKELFDRAQERLRIRRRQVDPTLLLERMRQIYRQYGTVTSKLIALDQDLPSAPTTYRHLGGSQAALHSLFADVHGQARDLVEQQIRDIDAQVEQHDDFLVINGQFTVAIQPSVPVNTGVHASWLFRADQRRVIDITLGVPLADEASTDILGFLALPRILMPPGWMRLSNADDGLVALHGHSGLDFIKELTQT